MKDQNFDSDSVMRYVQNLVQKSGVNPDAFVQLGQLAEQALQNKSVYPQFANEVISMGMAGEEEMLGQMNYQMLMAMIAMGRVSQKMMQGV